MTDKTCLIGTARDAIVGKASVVNSSYYLDSSEQSLVCTKGPSGKCQVPLLNRVYYSRMRAIRHIYDAYRQTCFSRGVSRVQILVLGAGYDTSFNKTSDPVFLVDYPEVIEERISKKMDGTAHNVNLVGGDLCQVEILFEALARHNFDVAAPTYVVLESVLAYMDISSVRLLLRFLSYRLTHVVGAIYDPVAAADRTRPIHRCAQGMLQTFAIRQVPLLSAQPSCTDICVLLRECGMKHVLSVSMLEAMHILAALESPSSASRWRPTDRWSEPTKEMETDCSGVTSAHKEHSMPTVNDIFDEFAALATLQRLFALSYFGSGCGADFFDDLTKIFFTGGPQSQRPKLSPTSSNTPVPASLEDPRGGRRGEDYRPCQLHPASQVRITALERRLRSFEAMNDLKPNHESVNIRNASPDDERDILTIFNEGHAVYRAKYPPVQSHMKQATKSIKAAMIAIGTSDTSHNKFWVAENVLRTKSGTSHEKGHRQGRETIGCVSMRKTTSTDKKGHDRDIGILSHLSVREECRGQGVGTALVQKIIGVAAADGCRAIELTTLADMKAARSLYVTLGFQERDVVDIGHGCKLVHMNMQL